jgi:Putative Flp pilus-assembly TadE/G-like
MRRQTRYWIERDERGQGLATMALMITVLLGACALAIDIVSFYSARAEAQRAADAAALAGASVFVSSSCTSSGSGACTQQESAAAAEAVQVANQNLVGGNNPNTQTSDVTFDMSASSDPRISVTVQRSTSHGNALPTFFGKIFGVNTVNVSATATAEAFNPSGTGDAVLARCVKPWAIPNCDPNHVVASGDAEANTYCSAGGSDYYEYYVDPNNNNAVVNPGWSGSGGDIGLTVMLKEGAPGAAVVPSDYFPIDIPEDTTTQLCPPTTQAGCSQLNGGGGGAQYRLNIACCNTNQITCGEQFQVDTQTGNLQGPTRQGAQCLIHASGAGLNQGQDIISTSSFPFTVTGGANNPNPALVGQTITQTDSMITTPIYDGSPVCSGSSCGGIVTIIGFVQYFITQVVPGAPPVGGGSVQAVITNISGCGQAGGIGGGPPPTVSGGTSSPVPIRLIQP